MTGGFSSAMACIKSQGLMWYFSETFLHPRTETCSSVSFRSIITVWNSVAPLTDVLSKSKLVRRVLNGMITYIISESSA